MAASYHRLPPFFRASPSRLLALLCAGFAALSIDGSAQSRQELSQSFDAAYYSSYMTIDKSVAAGECKVVQEGGST